MNRIFGVFSALAVAFTPISATAQTADPWIPIPGTGYELKFADLEWGPEESIQIEARQTVRRSQRSKFLFACGRNAWAIAYQYSIEQERWVPNPNPEWLSVTQGAVAQGLYNAICNPQ